MRGTAPVFVGIGASKDRPDVALRPSDESWNAANEQVGSAALVNTLRMRAPALIVLEARKRFEILPMGALARDELGVVIILPRQVRDFAKGKGHRAKTGRLDAYVLARFAESVRPEARTPPDPAAQELRGWITRRRQIVEMIVTKTNRLSSVPKHEWDKESSRKVRISPV